MNLTSVFQLFSILFVFTFLQSCEPTKPSDAPTKKALTEEESSSINKIDQRPSVPPSSDDQKTEEKRPASSSEKTKTNQFEKAIRSVEQIDYELKEFEVLNKEQNFLNKRIYTINRYRSRRQKTAIPLVNTTELLQVRSAFIKGTVDMGGRLFARADVESWEMKDEAAAIAVYQEIEAIRTAPHWEEISKSPITCFRKDNEIIFITPGGFYMLDKVSIISDFLKEAL